VRRSRLPLGLRLEGLPAKRPRSAGFSCRPVCASPSSCRSRSSPRRRRPRSATTTRTSILRGRHGPRGPRPGGAVRDASIAVYQRAAEHALERGIILADTKFEFGLAPDGTLVLGDEVLTPDSSRFWPADGYEPGRPQPSFDKQPVRDWATDSGWDRTPPAPAIPTTSSRAPRALPRRLRAHRRRAVRRLARPLRRARLNRTQDICAAPVPAGSVLPATIVECGNSECRR